jgi:hypothetical protein
VRLISVQVLQFPMILHTLTHRYYGMCVRCSPRAFRFRRPFLVTLLDEQKSNKKVMAFATSKGNALLPIAAFFEKESGRKKLFPKLNPRGRASSPQPVMSPQRRDEKSSDRLRFGATLNTLQSRPTHQPQFRDHPFAPHRFCPSW